jgi:hypothetical protein
VQAPEHEEKTKDTKEKSKEILLGKTRFSRLAMQRPQQQNGIVEGVT